MANKRMFSLDVVDTDAFQDLPVSSRYLYYELGMRADDDGFMKSPKRLLRTIGCTDDDLLLLVAKGFAIKFDSGVIVITDWRINNTIKADRYHPSVCSEKAQLGLLPNKRYFLIPPAEPSRNQDGTIGVPQSSIVEVSLVKDTTTTVAEAAVVPEAKTMDNSNLQQKSKKLEDVGIRTNVELLASRYSDAELDSYIAWAKATAKTDFAGFLYRALVDGWELPQKYVPKITCPRCNGTQLENYTLADGIETTGLCSLCKGKGFIRKETQNES